ncbi:hypothetical protein DIPPA_34357 [Diplonema papillatum]|nr:hypothetical protein DIPPA_34357 [Diplonema papillatum]
MANPGVRWVMAGWTGFIAENLIISENRTAIIDAMGDAGYHAAYSTLSTLSVGSILYGYAKYGRAPGNASWPLRAVGATLKMTGAVLLSQGLPPLRKLPGTANEVVKKGDAECGMRNMCPIDLTWAKTVEGKRVYGAKRITRHPELWGMAFIGLGTCVATTNPVRAAAAFGFFPVALFLGEHQDSRFTRGIGGVLPPDVAATTTNIPFLSVVKGTQSLEDAWQEAKQTNAVVAAAIALALI